MGSWANSVHVRTDDAAGVAATVHAILGQQGYGPSHEAPDPDDAFGMDGRLRGVRVSEAHGGWVSLLDSDMVNCQEVAAELSGRLDTWALSVFVNDSDSWHYMLYSSGDLIDEFDSMGEEAMFDALAGDLGGAVSAAQIAELQQQLLERAQSFQQRIQEAMPPEMREMQARWQSGQMPTPEETERYGEWVNTSMPDLMAEMQETIAQMLPGLADRLQAGQAGPQPADADADLEDESAAGANKARAAEVGLHAERLQPLVAAGVSGDQVQEALTSQSVFAEEDLRRFLPLVGIGPIWADLSYRYIEEFSPEELASEDVRVAAHLTFEHGDRGPGLRMV